MKTFIFFCVIAGCLSQKSNKKNVTTIRWMKGPAEISNSFWSLNCDFPGNDYDSKKMPADDCIVKCSQSQECTHFTWTRSRGGTCWFKSGTVSIDRAVVRKAAEIRCGYILTPTETSSENGIIWKDRNWAFGCDFYNRDLTTKQTRSHLCEKECQTTPECTHYTWTMMGERGGDCVLKSGDVSKEDAFTIENQNTVCGLLESTIESKQTEWHLIIGGKNVTDLASMELFNWKSGEQCYLGDLPTGVRIHSGLIFDGSILYCGGFSLEVPQTACYRYSREEQLWEDTSSLLAPSAAGASSIFVPKIGWLIFGGDGNTLTRSQKLSLYNGSWELGPELYHQKPITGACIVQVTATMTAFLGGSNDNHEIVTLDWTSLKYTTMEERFEGKRWKSACALAKGRTGGPMVYIAGGLHKESKGMEAWDPLQETTERIADLLPPEDSLSFGLNHAQLIAINDGSELLMYGGWQGDYVADIWKYNIMEDSWTQLGSMLIAREEQVVLPVTGFQCPNDQM